MRLIDADALIMRLSDWALGASPNESDRGETRALRQREYDTIEHCVGVIVSSPTVDGWISVKDKMPMLVETVLFTGKRYDGGWFGAKRGFFDGIFWHADDLGTIYSFTPVTHWRPMPEPPEEE